jgi:hypothetical protein
MINYQCCASQIRLLVLTGVAADAICQDEKSTFLNWVFSDVPAVLETSA